MWRVKFYTKSPVGFAYKLLISFAWYLAIIAEIYHYALTGEVHPHAGILLVVGFILFTISKFSIIKKGHLNTAWADSAQLMSPMMKLFYFGGYIVMLIGFLLSFRH